ncbi:MAG: hypothetical protein MUF23_13135, partial [Pirellula sp.]|nr:hypothetical protein [Pirellula sp.]
WRAVFPVSLRRFTVAPPLGLRFIRYTNAAIDCESERVHAGSIIDSTLASYWNFIGGFLHASIS